MKIEDVFKDAENGVLTLEQFTSKVKEAGGKFVDLSEGNYVSQNKYSTDIKNRDDQISELNGIISQRDSDLDSLQKQLEAAGNDAEKLGTLASDLSALQVKYDEDTKSYQAQLSKQARDFAIKEHAATKKFSSAAAKRDYIQSMKNSEDVKLSKKGLLLGLDEFDTDYANENADAFLVESKNPKEDEQTQGISNVGKTPMFIEHTSGEPFKDDSSTGSFGFSFMPRQN